MGRPRWVAFCAGNIELRVEEIGPNDWLGQVIVPDRRRDTFFARTEEIAKDSAVDAFRKEFPDYLPQKIEWRNMSELSEDDWVRGLPDYPPKKGID